MGRKARRMTALACALVLGAQASHAQWIVEDPMAILQQLLTDLDLVTSGELTLDRLSSIIERSSEMTDKLFGTAEAFSEGATLYGDCVRLVGMSERYMKATSSNCRRLKCMYSSMEDWTGRDYAAAIGDVDNMIDTYRYYNESLKKMIAALKKDSRTIEAKRQAIRETTEDIRKRIVLQTDSVNTVIRAEVYSSALDAAVRSLDVYSDSEVASQNRIYGDTVEQQSGTGAQAGSTGRAVLMVISLLLVVETVFIALRVMKGERGAEWAVIRLLSSYTIALITALTIGRYI